MSMKRLALLSLLNNGGLNNNRTSNTEMSTTTGSPAVPSEGVNVMLGGYANERTSASNLISSGREKRK